MWGSHLAYLVISGCHQFDCDYNSHMRVCWERARCVVIMMTRIRRKRWARRRGPKVIQRRRTAEPALRRWENPRWVLTAAATAAAAAAQAAIPSGLSVKVVGMVILVVCDPSLTIAIATRLTATGGCTGSGIVATTMVADSDLWCILESI